MKNNHPDSYYLSKSDLPFEDFLQFGISVDCVLFGYKEGRMRVLLIQRGAEPYLNSWAVPGDLVYPDEDLEASAGRILNQLTGLHDIYVEQFHTFGAADRHPLGRVITVGYYSLVKREEHQPIPSSWAENVNWFDIRDLPELAFDHKEILDKAIETLKRKVRTEPVGFELLPKKFSLLELQGVYEALLNQTFDKPNFRKKILSMDLLVHLNEYQNNVAHRPAKLFTFDMKRYESLQKQGFSFEL